ncbi:MAG TPA: outer-membrane lipoprotein carrier protein LolA [SAR86 cluster bacterium]|nr:outer-membrane lipoprotein carrier protein LolA [SAR86 cluster bacterium]|tara:strand:- start:14366 stop:14977 length:612 start_codon:yes stop_codon:yes gene_type:complete
MSKHILSLILPLCFLELTAATINEGNLLNFLGKKDFFSGSFIQITNQNQKERKVNGEIKINRKGMFKVVYSDPLNEIISSNGSELFRLDEELEQLNISPIDKIFLESPIGLFAAKQIELENLFFVDRCYTEKKILTCTLRPKTEESFLQELTVKFSKEVIKSISYIDSFNQIVHLNFLHSDWGRIPLEEFSFSIPEGIDVVRH